MIVAGTGHRPNKLGGYGEEAKDKLIHVASLWIARNNPDIVISGMALGWDQALAWAAVKLGISFHAYIPFAGQEGKWPKPSQEEFCHLMSYADKIIEVCKPGYAPWKMQERNKAMVDAADVVLAMWDGTDGGTGNCIRYAENAGKPIDNVYNLWREYK